MPHATEDMSNQHRMQKPGLWLLEDHRVHYDWMKGVVEHVDKHPRDLHPSVKEFQQLIESNSRIYQLVEAMYDEVPDKYPYISDPSGRRLIRDYKHMLEVLNYLLTVPPLWSNHSHQMGLVGLPYYALFDWPMGTTSGYAFFLQPQVNTALRKILNVWGEFLKSPKSAICLNDKNGWLGPTGKPGLVKVGNLNGATDVAFEELYQCDPSKEFHGYKSWDDFFTRSFKWEHRPVASPEDQNVICNACESTPYRLTQGAHGHDKFWMKGMPYSIKHILNHEPECEEFVGGTIYQAFLTALSYHRWHSPVDGTIKKIVHVEGNYFSQPLSDDLGRHKDQNMVDPGTSQAYLTVTAARALIFIESDNKAIGLMCMVQVGMFECSTCEVTVKEGRHVKKGDQIGMFHFGGSTHCLLFRESVKISGFPEAGLNNTNIPVRGELAIVQR